MSDLQQEPSSRLILPIVEEQLNIGTAVVEKGSVRINKTISEEEHTITMPLLQEELQVQRIPINQYVSEAPVVRQEGNTTIFPVVKEVLVVEKRLVLVEEIHVIRELVQETHEESHIVRSDEVSIERTGSK